MHAKEKLLHWTIFNVIIALLPLIFNSLFRILKSELEVDFHPIFFRGELFIISAAIAADAIGEFMIGEISNKYARLIIGGTCVIMLALSTLLFAAVSVNAEVSSPLSQSRVTNFSIVVFMATVISSGACKYLTENDS